MVVGSAVADERADRVFHALADATRRDIVRRSMAEAASVSSIAKRYPMSFAAVQKHVAVLEAAGLVRKERRGRESLVHGDVTTIQEAHRLLDEFEAMWRRRIDRFGALLADEEPGRADR